MAKYSLNKLERAHNQILSRLLQDVSELSDAERDNLYLLFSYGKKSLLLLFICIESGIDFKVLFFDSGRHSTNILNHIKNINIFLDENNIDMVSMHHKCTRNRTNDHKCPTIPLRIKHNSKKDTVHISTACMEGFKTLYKVDHPIQKLSNESNADKLRMVFDKEHSMQRFHKIYPFINIPIDLREALHDHIVPSRYQFPINSIATCNSPICPDIFKRHPHLRTKYTDWTE